MADAKLEFAARPLRGLDALPAGAPHKIVHLVRHAQGAHNRAFEESGSDRQQYLKWDWLDARLTDVGESQAAALRPALAQQAIDVVLVSPLSRAISTGVLAVPPGPRFVAVELLRERYGVHPCDKRRPRAAIQADFPAVDLSGLHTDEDAMWSEVRESHEHLVARTNQMLHVLRERPETHIAVFTHNDFLTALLFHSGLQLDDASLRVKFDNAQHMPIVLTWSSASAPTSGAAAGGGP